MTFRTFRLFAPLLALSLAACAAPTASSTDAGPETPVASPAPVSDDTAAGAGQVPTLDTSCRVDSDCTVKDVGNCCGTFPACVNVDSPADPQAVMAECQRSGMASVCGFREIQACACVASRCEAVDSAVPVAR
ncbi:hypothetical protein [Luteimonas yindakuii]|uniref:hypothetical protein n=1 Tax=Luteimonas yindakuii TaxID=2565782 RepID=UPI001FB7F88D|nr:hypothetical protein [Luteimonas yindakuii]